MSRSLAFFILLFASALAWADDSTFQAHSKATFKSEFETLVPGSNWLGLYLELEDEWHSYWRNPGDSASAPIFDWTLPEGVKLEKVHFPRPERIPFGPLQSIGYNKEALYLFEVKVSPEAVGQELDLVLDAEWVNCKVECVPGIFKFQITRKVVAKRGPQAGGEKELFRDFKLTLPKTKVLSAVLREDGEFYRLEFPDKILKKYKDLFPFHNGKVNNKPPVIFTETILKLQKSGITNSKEITDKFLLVTDRGRSYVVDARTPDPSFWLMLAFAFFGGLILNLMPCVFPVLTLKVYSLSSSRGASRAKAVLSQFAYAFGVLTSFWVLAGFIVVLRFTGSNLGWGFQLQSPVFVGLMAALFTVMALSFLGWVRLPGLDRLSGAGQGLASQSGFVGSFFTGVLAVIVASPCTAPFMGAAMGYALSQSPFVVFSIFTGLGFGLAFPFLAIAILPESLVWLPKPGAWMETFKKAMAVPLLATAAWLVWVLGLQLGMLAPDTGDRYTVFSEEKVEKELAAGRPVFVNFTAAWCISCQVNEQVVFSKDRVQEFLNQHNVAQLKADWTEKDDEIGAVLKKYGRAGVPLYLFFPEKGSKPELLPEILTEEAFLNRLSDALNL